ncbi:hypothetical protein EZV62_000778 [Acer yangbiense]|uniref:PGG domain-containing protein n=1 Tax=Acer yangbiense TaxID=1000413 RepID=A0A5C7ISV8_9ROSI|nr:hypothetical protein EZV62_000778 [Acer yangbiense]
MGGLHFIMLHITVTFKFHTFLEFYKSAAYVTDTSRRMTPLHLAASQGHKDVMREIILHCPECYELIDERGWNVLHFAMASLNKECCSLLENPSIKKLVREKDANGNTPLHVFATCTRTTGLMNLLVDIFDQVRGDGSRAINRQNISVEDAFIYGCPELEQEILALSGNTDNGIYPRDAIAMFFSISGMYIYFIMSIERLIKKNIYLFELGTWMMVVAMGAMVIAFVAGTYAVSAPSLILMASCCHLFRWLELLPLSACFPSAIV